MKLLRQYGNCTKIFELNGVEIRCSLFNTSEAIKSSTKRCEEQSVYKTNIVGDDGYLWQVRGKHGRLLLNEGFKRV